MEFIHNFHEGMDKDVSKMLYPNKRVYEIKNFKLTTEGGLSTLSLENEKGNRFDFSIPDTQGVYKILLNGESGDVTINGETISVTGSETSQQLYDAIIALPLSFTIDLNVSQSDNYILLFGLDDLTVTSTNPDLIEEVVEPLSNLKILHIDSYEDTLILFTVGTSSNSNGQIWMVPYVNNLPTNLTSNNLTPSYHLKYNNKLNFSTEHYIRKSIVRYENEKIGRIYFTDFYNPVRSFNFLDVDGYSIEPGDLEFIPNVSFTKPILQDVSDGGAIPVGSMVQFGYILTKGGKETLVSPLSDLLPLYSANDEVDEYHEITGNIPQASATKQVTYLIKDIDPDFETIKHVAILYEYNNLPVIKIFSEENIPSSYELTVTFTNNEESIILTEQELNMISTQFTHCKDLTQKDNRLIAVNTSSSRFEITDEEFDARVYRFDSSGLCRVKDKSGNLTTITSPDFELDSEHDAINPFNNEDDPDYSDYQFTDDGTTLGASGKFISLTFFEYETILDNDLTTTDTFQPFLQDQMHENVLVPLTDSSSISFNNQFPNLKSNFLHSAIKGYVRDEIYRFGIVFYDLKGNPSFTKWIADIKMPSYQLHNIVERVGNSLIGKQLIPVFKITIPDSLKEKISGYEIVRVERDKNNKTIVGSGLLHPIAIDGTDLRHSHNYSLNTGTYTGTFAHKFFNFISPNFIFNQLNEEFKTGDYIQYEGDFNLGSEFYSFNITIPEITFGKCGELGVIDIYKFNIEDKVRCAYNSSFVMADWFVDDGGYNQYYNQDVSGFKGGERELIALDFSTSTHSDLGDFFSTVYTIPSTIIPYVTYRRKLTKQYGGNTYEERSNSRYISTGALYTDTNLNSIYVFGGDSFINYVNIDITQNLDSATDPRSRTIMFPCESSFNVDLRYGNHFINGRNASTPIADQYAQENYLYNTVYLQENNAKKIFIPKPFKFNADDEQPFAIWVSEKKVNGEMNDSWVKFLVNNQIEVDGVFGPINAVANHQGRVYFFQDRAIGVVPINERIVTQNQDGIELALGTGDVISSYGYISNNIGCFHTSAVVKSDDYLYFADARTKKFYRLSLDTKQPLSDLKGMSSWFYDNLANTENTDSKTSLLPIGVHGVYDNRFNRVLFSINNGVGKVISFNEVTNSFESLYDIDTSVIHSTGKKIFSVPGLPSVASRNDCYMHYEGDYCSFYGTVYPSEVILLSNGGIKETKEWNNLSWYSECYNDLEEDISDETFNLISVYNDHQTTGNIDLNNTNLKRRFRYWRFAIPRDLNSYNQQGRMRNPWVFVKLRKNNDENNRFIVHPINIYYSI